MFGGEREESAEETKRIPLREEESLGTWYSVNQMQQEEVTMLRSALVQVKQGQNRSLDLVVGSILVSLARAVLVNCWG